MLADAQDMRPSRLPAGKLPAEMLQGILARFPVSDPAVMVAAAIGEDAAVIDNGGPELLAVKTDPITFAAEDPGRYLLAVNGNDLATVGAEPHWLLVTALLPEGVTGEEVQSLFESLREACVKESVTLVGGHTEISVGLDRPILVGCLLGTVPRDRVLRTAGARPGDALLLAGGIALEGTAILAREHADRLRESGVDAAVIERAAGWLHEPGISVLPAARILRESRALHALHDPTEGGLITALHEMAEAAEVGLRIEREAIPVLTECRLICDELGLDPLGLLASGALLAAVEADHAQAMAQALQSARLQAAIIGRTVAPEQGRTFTTGRPLPSFARDELARYLEGLRKE